MSCCSCTQVLDFCDTGVCGSIDLEIKAQIDGIHKMIVDYLGGQVTLYGDFITDDNISFYIGSLNENYEFTGELYDPNDDRIVIRQDSIDYDCIKFRTVLNLSGTSGSLPVLNIVNTVVVEDVIGQDPVITGTLEDVTGLDADSNTITSDAFIDERVWIIRGNIPIPGIDPLDGSNYFTKLLANNFITLSRPLALGEFIRIQTIP